ncbi:MAG TPA: VCBS repeat-containing protein, partial [Acidimicrobiales bacterium]|nr:VCBS repeat-containing protein [Acidimicrobiales bacterium]
MATVAAAALVLVPASPAAATPVVWGDGVTIATPNSALHHVAGDIDRDGDVDLVTADVGGLLSWHRNDGDQGWETIEIAVGTTRPHSIDLADMDGDGDLDVVAVVFHLQAPRWYENDDPSSAGWARHDWDDQNLGSDVVLAAGDLDGDGDADIVLGDSTAITHLVWYENNGGGTSFEDPVDIDVGRDARFVDMVDVDGDGVMDVVTIHDGAAEADEVIVYAGDGDPTDGGWDVVEVGGTSGFRGDVVASDVDRDGDLDLAANLQNEGVRLFENPRTRDDGWESEEVAGDVDAQGLTGGDLDGDGDDDLAVTTGNAGLSRVLVLDNDGTPWEPNWTQQEIASEPLNAIGGDPIAADIDGDGDLDLSRLDQFPDRLVFYENERIHRDASGWATTEENTAQTFLRAVTTADVDRDSDLDVIAAVQGTSDVVVFPNLGGGDLGAPVSLDGAQDGAFALATADVDRDGWVDIVVSESGAPGGGRVAWYGNDGDGTFTYAGDVAAGFTVTALVAVDMDRDGHTDIAVTDISTDRVAWYRNFPAGTFSLGDDIASSGADPTAIDAGSIDGDSFADLLVGHPDGTLVWHPNSEGTVQAARALPDTADEVRDVELVDLDRDGDLDVLFADPTDAMHWWENDGPDIWLVGVLPSTPGDQAVGADDLDGDGDLDLVTTSVVGEEMSTWLNDGEEDPSFSEGDTFSTPVDPARAASLAIADLDEDGDADLVSAVDSTVRTHLNSGVQLDVDIAGANVDQVAEGDEDDLFSVTTTHRGRDGDNDATLTAIELSVADGMGDPIVDLSDGIAAFRTYRDDGDGIFEEAIDTAVGEVAPTTSPVTIPVEDDDGVEHGEPVMYHVTIELTEDATETS